ncbi:hypothetical protein CYMTET_16114 [Cymbomonas tetramitiformis]|uniref:Uncharacterized protein n=1 Tax=Cymbomonas tetramitiformis TaxID=36881 RepID=A0AAE0GD26_9CHLO|nr:hypothetical protein CYMTET_16114 [Cymbomonas tetramitiformis]
MAKTANKPRMTCARPSKSDHKTSASEQHRQTPGEAATGLPTIESMQAYDASSDGSESDQSVKITPLGMSESEQEEYSTPEADKATGMEDVQQTEDITTEHTPDKRHHSNSPPKRQQDRKVHFAESRIPPVQKTSVKQQDGLPGSAGPRAGNPEGAIPGFTTQVSQEDLRRALDRPINYRKVDSAPTEEIPSLLGHGSAKAVESPLEKAHALKLGVPVVRGDRLALIHVRSVTGSSQDPNDTGPTGFPYTGTPQLKIVDLDESIKEVLKYLRYLNALLFDISDSPENIVFDLQHTHIWLNRSGRARQIDLAFQNRPLAAFVLFNPVFRLPLHVVPQAHQTCNREQPVLPCIYVWSPWVPVKGPVAGRSVLVYGPQLSVKSIEDVSNILATTIIERKESRHELGQLVDRIRKGTARESSEDATFREVLLLEAVSPTAAELIVQQPYPWGFAMTTCWLPSKEVSDAVATREVAIVDKKQVLLDHHRCYIVQAVVEHMEKLTANTTTLTGTDEVFDFHVPSRQWAPSVPGNPSSLLQWKRNSGGYAINYYGIFTEEAYDAVAKAGKQTVRVLAGVDDTGRRITASITVEVGRWSAKGTGTIQRQTPRAARDKEARGGRIDKIAEEVASKLINKVESKAGEVLQQAATTSKQPTPETKTLLKNINRQLERFNESKPVTLDELRDLHKEQERSAGVRHTEITQEVRGFHQTYRETGSAMVSTLTALTDRLTGEGKQQAPDQPLRFVKKTASQAAAEDDEYRGIPYRGPKVDPRKKQAPTKRPAANAGTGRLKPSHLQKGGHRGTPKHRHKGRHSSGAPEPLHPSQERGAAHPPGLETQPDTLGKSPSQGR